MVLPDRRSGLRAGFRPDSNRESLNIYFNAVTRGFEKPREIALELVYRAENRCKSSGARAGGLFQAFLGPIWARKGPNTWIFRPRKSLKALLTALESTLRPADGRPEIRL